jgi:hypothetical protein
LGEAKGNQPTGRFQILAANEGEGTSSV